MHLRVFGPRSATCFCLLGNSCSAFVAETHQQLRKFVMSASELSQLMREAGLTVSSSTPSGGGGDKIQVEHVLVVTLSESTEKLCKGVILGLLGLGRQLVESCHIMAISGSVGLVLWGTSRLIESLRSRRPTGESRNKPY